MTTVVSHTRMAMLSRCGEQYRRRYVEGEILPPGVALIVGGAVDSSVSENMRHKMEHDSLLALDAVGAIAADECAMRWSAGDVILSDDEVMLGAAKVKGEAVDKSVRLARLHAKEVAPAIEPTHVQRGFEVELDGALLTGYMDIQERRRVRDTKTSKRAPQANAADTSLQLGIYALAARVLDDTLPDVVQLDYLIDGRKPVSLSLASTRDDAALDAVLARVNRFVETVRAGAFQPVDPDSWVCSRQFCGYHSTCPFAVRPVSVAVHRN